MKALAFLCVIALALVAANRVVDPSELLGYSYAEYLKDFNKQYSTEEELAIHEARFHETLAAVLRHNADKTKTWKESINKFSDMTESEFKAYRGYSIKMGASMTAKAPVHEPRQLREIPTDLDWRNAGIVTPVKDQGQCGSCWAFATAETIESSTAINNKTLLVLSPQNVVSCTPNPNHCGGTGGCGGATAELGFTYVAGNGIALEADWPYTATDGVCNEATHKKAAIDSGYVKLIENNGTDLLYSVADPAIGPIAISVDASTWSRYFSGIYNGCSQTSPDIDHAVQLVGYGHDATANQDYWLVRNSWGATWGEKGYIRLYRGANEKCATDIHPSDGSGCDGGPTTITVCGTCGIWYDNSYPTQARLIN